MKTLQELDSEIALLEQKLETVHGSPTEVYARIVGYYRSVRNWNKGKLEEFSHRKMFTEDNPKIKSYTAGCESVQTAVNEPASQLDSKSASQLGSTPATPAYIEIYMRKGCPNCPPVCNYCRILDTDIHFIDTDTEHGAESAIAHTVYSCPAVIAYTAQGEEIARAYTLAEVQAWNIPEYAAQVVNA
ncbi:MAG: anaerobic ribonucleoside-triphosphate reductase [Treponema sp.]